MKYSFLTILAICLFAACASSQDDSKQQADTTKEQTISRKAPASANTNTAPKQRYNSQPYTNISRPKEKVEQNFPYDIDMKTVEGEVLNSADLLKNDGKPTVLLFWLTTCYPCRLELKAIASKYEAWQEEADFRLVAISTDFSKNYEKFVQRVNESQWPFEAYNDVNREFRRVMPGALNGLPQTFILDANGEIVYHKRKYRSGDEDALFEKIKEITKG